MKTQNLIDKIEEIKSIAKNTADACAIEANDIVRICDGIGMCQ